MKILKKPYERIQFIKFVEECNKQGNVRVEKYDGNAYALYDYEIIKDGEVIDLRGTEEYETEQAQLAKEKRKEEIMNELSELDNKRIRAICEPDNLRDDGTSWLDYYNNKIAELRNELNSL